MRIIIEHTESNAPWAGKYIYESSNDSHSLGEIIPIIKGMLVSVGYHPASIQDYFRDDSNDWFPEHETPNAEEIDGLIKLDMGEALNAK